MTTHSYYVHVNILSEYINPGKMYPLYCLQIKTHMFFINLDCLSERDSLLWCYYSYIILFLEGVLTVGFT